MKVGWSQKLVYQRGQFSLELPFSFPAYVNPPVVSKTSKREKILLNVISGFSDEITCSCSSHALKVKENVILIDSCDLKIGVYRERISDKNVSVVFYSQELRREVGKMGFFYESEVKTWSVSNFSFSYTVSSNVLQF